MRVFTVQFKSQKSQVLLIPYIQVMPLEWHVSCMDKNAIIILFVILLVAIQSVPVD